MVDAWISSGVVLHSTSDGAMPSDVIRCAVLMVGAGEFDDVLGDRKMPDIGADDEFNGFAGIRACCFRV